MTKRNLAVLLAALLVVFVTGCGKNAKEPEPVPVTAAPSASGSAATGNSGSSSAGAGGGATSPSATPAAPTEKQDARKTYQKVTAGPLKKGEKANIGPITVSLDDVAVTKQATGLPQGYAYVTAKLTVVNNEDSVPYTINVTDHFKMTTPAARDSRMNVQATGLRNPKLQGSVDRGTSASGWLGYLVKVSEGTYKFQFNHPDWGDVTWEFPLS